jgi:probable rRNA maturation factor
VARAQRPVAPSPLAVEISDRQKVLRVAAEPLQRLMRRALAAEGIVQAEISILLVDDRRMAKLHKQWLGISGPTDVITFDLSESGAARPHEARAGLQGDIVVSAETARRTARQLGWTPRQELILYLLHGVLHLTGYDDILPADRRLMRAREKSLLQQLGLPIPPAGPPRERHR